jgi:hypothetical protein
MTDRIATRDEFIDYWMANTGLPSSCRTEDGAVLESGSRWHAGPCDCGEETCTGWAMRPDIEPDLLRLAKASGHPSLKHLRRWYWIPDDG